ncbi:MAG TPA: hypothetical protein PLE92_03030 [Lentisphaeria bacterium]|nr:hypothetical protein [Lentisphaerota bacterium]OQC11658.1 MAG: Low molecular weight phosphotyrosine protein phosphatase [Lentisphaerae bacterium ADurb.Bin082]HPY89862.1 hypothetical protein [Lentisphaeria bacterium]HQC52079.1 hypothetical protein [Lentisphaeria bacterium]HQL88722.1 hypothetical protein [Lentisphaeria bacterium]
MIKILFICKDNRSCSPMAAAYLKHRLDALGATDFEVTSCGLSTQHNDAVCEGAREALAAVGLEPLRIGVQAIQLFHVKTANLILCMTQEQQKRLEKKFVSAIGKTRPLMSIIQSERDVFEPRCQDTANHGHCLAMMRPALDALAERLA